MFQPLRLLSLSDWDTLVLSAVEVDPVANLRPTSRWLFDGYGHVLILLYNVLSRTWHRTKPMIRRQSMRSMTS